MQLIDQMNHLISQNEDDSLMNVTVHRCEYAIANIQQCAIGRKVGEKETSIVANDGQVDFHETGQIALVNTFVDLVQYEAFP